MDSNGKWHSCKMPVSQKILDGHSVKPQMERPSEQMEHYQQLQMQQGAFHNNPFLSNMPQQQPHVEIVGTTSTSSVHQFPSPVTIFSDSESMGVSPANSPLPLNSSLSTNLHNWTFSHPTVDSKDTQSILQLQQKKIEELEARLNNATTQINNLQSNSQNSKSSRYWTPTEHQKFLEALDKYGPKDFKAIAAYVSTRTPTQVRTHAQKYFLRIKKEENRVRDSPDNSSSSDWSAPSSPAASEKSSVRPIPNTRDFDCFVFGLESTKNEQCLEKRCELIKEKFLPHYLVEDIMTWAFVYQKTVERMQHLQNLANANAANIGMKRARGSASLLSQHRDHPRERSSSKLSRVVKMNSLHSLLDPLTLSTLQSAEPVDYSLFMVTPPNDMDEIMSEPKASSCPEYESQYPISESPLDFQSSNSLPTSLRPTEEAMQWVDAVLSHPNEDLDSNSQRVFGSSAIGQSQVPNSQWMSFQAPSNHNYNSTVFFEDFPLDP